MVQNGWISDFHGLLTLTLDLGMVITFLISHRVLPVYQISSKSKELFVNGRTHVRTDERTEICHLWYYVDFQSLEVNLMNWENSDNGFAIMTAP